MTREDNIQLITALLMFKRKLLSLECDIDQIVKLIAKQYKLNVILEPEPDYVK